VGQILSNSFEDVFGRDVRELVRARRPAPLESRARPPTHGAPTVGHPPTCQRPSDPGAPPARVAQGRLLLAAPRAGSEKIKAGRSYRSPRAWPGDRVLLRVAPVDLEGPHPGGIIVDLPPAG
jgi:hypothetical protein